MTSGWARAVSISVGWRGRRSGQRGSQSRDDDEEGTHTQRPRTSYPWPLYSFTSLPDDAFQSLTERS